MTQNGRQTASFCRPTGTDRPETSAKLFGAPKNPHLATISDFFFISGTPYDSILGSGHSGAMALIERKHHRNQSTWDGVQCVKASKKTRLGMKNRRKIAIK